MEDYMDHVKKTIVDATTHLRALEQQVKQQKLLINGLHRMAGLPEAFAEADIAETCSTGGIRSDQFYGQPLATVVRTILDLRKAGNLGAASVAEIYSAMVQGGYRFETENEENRKRALRISLSKNPIFHKLQNGRYGLRQWYPAIKEGRSQVPAAASANESKPADDYNFEERERAADAQADQKESKVKKPVQV
jgi:hypothetical protein